MKISFGDVLLARFPYTDLTGDKRRPVLVLSANNDGEDIVVCTITSRPHTGPYDIPVAPTADNGLKSLSRVQFDKVATLERSIVAGRLGRLPEVFMNDHKSLFFTLFGFQQG
ncbi:type II toxin-antitoxin system PemK/MazF family toxin [Azospirillum brasilense]|uniref:type II toxin-antitoxin system PemK/MazF family toxin n=1 Tax=Azospirillum brasilense TaxID=192 RepID=UPI00190AF22D|nr:type II toxin-antitoxin system PemK/MazF family toxin [Azospirillum brasilense]MBK3736792.1 type II toxin-antitoxin system PemK/MazF family toxin [Azospirillum brasilense]